MEKDWWKNSVVYQVYPRSFSDSNGDGIGDLNGIRSRLPYLKELGVDVVWLSPVYKSPGDDGGYDISDYCDIDPVMGNLDDMKNLLREADELGIKIIMDLVVNHTSDEHPWFQSALQDVNSPYRDFYVWRKGGKDKPVNGLDSTFGGSAWQYDPKSDMSYLHLFSKKQPDLNWENPKLRQEIYKMMNWWIDQGISGFRMDVIDLIGKEPDRMITENGPMLHEYLKEMNENVLRGKNLLTVGECWGASPETAILYSDPNRDELSMVFQFEHVQLDQQPGKHKWDLKELELKDLKKVMNKWQQGLYEKGWNSLFWNNHDLPRIVSRWGNDSEEYRVRSAKMLATLLHGMQGTPYIYQGEELGMTNADYDKISDFQDIEARNMAAERIAEGYDPKDVLHSLQVKARDNARTPMQWNDEENAGFSTGKPWYPVNHNYKTINAKAALADPDSIFHYYQKLIALRKASDVIKHGDFKLVDENNPNVFAYIRSWKGEKLLVVCNFYEKPTEFHLDLKEAGINEPTGKVLISNYDLPERINLDHLKLRPYEAVMIELK